MSTLDLKTSQLDAGWAVVSVGGEVDLATVDQLQTAMKSVLESGRTDLAVDLRSTSFMDSTGLKSLVEAGRSCSENDQRFAVIVSGGPVSRLIDLSGIDSTITVLDSLEELSEIG